jgi:hypothetical protein
MYMTHGVFTRTQAVDPSKPGEPVLLTAGVARFQPKTRRMEIFAEGTSNPWGVDFDARGNAFVSACVIDHFFHLAPGGLYQRQAGQPPYPYAYDLLPSIVDHKHHMAAYAGVNIYLGDQYPAEFRGMALQGNIHDNAIHRDRLTAQGSTFLASANGDFLRANDGWFMPVSLQTGPDGAVWVMDWYDKYPCYQNAGADPEGVDRERGRIWRIVWAGDQPGRPVPSRPAGLALAERSTPELVQTLGHSNVWHRRTAQRILAERPDIASQKSALFTRLKSSGSEDARLAALWTLFSAGLADDAVLDEAADASVPSLRMWAARFTGENNRITGHGLAAVFGRLVDGQYAPGPRHRRPGPGGDFGDRETSRDRQGVHRPRLALPAVDGPRAQLALRSQHYGRLVPGEGGTLPAPVRQAGLQDGPPFLRCPEGLARGQDAGDRGVARLGLSVDPVLAGWPH